MRYKLAGCVVAFEGLCAGALQEMQGYRYSGPSLPEAEFTVTEEAFRDEAERWISENRAEIEAYLASRQYYHWLLSHEASYIHACAFEMDGWAYLFTADSGTGKSTHANLWRQRFGAERVHLLNDDKPFLRFREDGTLWACGSPWCGKVPENQNAEAPLAAICILRQAKENSIRQLGAQEAVVPLMRQIYLPEEESALGEALHILERIVQTARIYLLDCNISEDAAALAYQAMRPAGEGAKRI